MDLADALNLLNVDLNTGSGSGKPSRGGGGGRLPGRVGMTVLLLCWLLLGVVPFAVAVPDFRLATGEIGTPGTLTVVSCTALGKGRYDCRGRFVPDDGGAATMVAASPDSAAGDVGRAQLTPEGDRALPSGTKGVLSAMAMPALGLCVLAFLPYSVMYALRVRRGRKAAVVGGGVVTAASLVLLVVAVVAASS
ncbi:hypothetical protein [Nonomuraea cavernae]|uniref:Uncharacterized protein n=1 Tax=Nonomuraea cavernae TaxID=2045107 RepID=A0A917YXP1_9ACTN|nr:hypothetical protein [Nonomuraea cavernae]MCA2186884.1 hypothetical protein [Nonomuraea cavernae]GGO67300.1 hypothetical protein GCM10012289_23390 [Nonomuraea cavernae]